MNLTIFLGDLIPLNYEQIEFRLFVFFFFTFSV